MENVNCCLAQIKPPHPEDRDPHPRLLLDGYELHCGDTVTAWLPGVGMTDIRLEIDWDITGENCWYIPGFREICPIGLWCKV